MANYESDRLRALPADREQDRAAKRPASEELDNNPDAKRTKALQAVQPQILIQEKQLPNMPKDYIARLVYNRTHLSLDIVKMPLEVIGRNNLPRIQALQGIRIAPHGPFEGLCQSCRPVMHFLTFADNYATGYFSKQGFTKTLLSTGLSGPALSRIYNGVTFMQCSMVSRIRYSQVSYMLLKQKETVQVKIQTLSKSKSHVIHQPPQQWANSSVITPIDPLEIPAIRATGWSPDMDELGRVPSYGPHFIELRRFLYQVQNHKQAWPFQAPVNKDEVPDYYEVIETPMDPETWRNDCGVMFMLLRKTSSTISS
ncbi:histone acetyltransferase GCN5-like protein [Apodospora peruviana]|uniref:Histone acetyltransferase GCN5-like protein n=1 Tax=Apodospora peruviana TaxID=516989 RepID=A0AAE0M1R2_9PEZI|nr:histone acetyltransferase GCN5-like protein [Apodospora peruviana]